MATEAGQGRGSPQGVATEAQRRGTRPRGDERPLPVRIARWTSAVVGFVATLLGLVFVLFPALKPDEPSPTRDARLSNPTAELITWGQSLDRRDLDRAPYDASALRRRGVYVEFDYVITGYKDKALPLRSQLIDARRGGLLGRSRDALITPEVSKDAANWSVWLPLPTQPVRRAYVQLQFYKEAGDVPIGNRLRTQPFEIRSGVRVAQRKAPRARLGP